MIAISSLWIGSDKRMEMFESCAWKQPKKGVHDIHCTYPNTLNPYSTLGERRVSSDTESHSELKQILSQSS